MRLARGILIWATLVARFACRPPSPPQAISSNTAVRFDILAGFAGIVALGFVLVQPSADRRILPGLSRYRARRVHYWIGGALVVAVVFHVGACGSPVRRT